MRGFVDYAIDIAMTLFGAERVREVDRFVDHDPAGNQGGITEFVDRQAQNCSFDRVYLLDRPVNPIRQYLIQRIMVVNNAVQQADEQGIINIFIMTAVNKLLGDSFGG